MDKLNVEALLDLNPQVDREAIKARLEKIAKTGRAKIKGDPASPYGGRRVTTDDKMKWTSHRGTRRSP